MSKLCENYDTIQMINTQVNNRSDFYMILKESPTRIRNRKKIVDVAEQLFLEKGIGHTTMIDIAEKAQVGRKTIYNYFDSKEFIAKYVFDLYMEKIFYTLKSNIDFSGCKTNFEKVRVLFEHFLLTLLKLKKETIYTVHYDYYSHCQANSNFVLNTIADADFSDILVQIFSEDDGSIDSKGKDPLVLLPIIGQSFMTFVSRMFFKGYKRELDSGINEQHLYDFLDIIMDGIKKV